MPGEDPPALATPAPAPPAEVVPPAAAAVPDPQPAAPAPVTTAKPKPAPRAPAPVQRVSHGVQSVQDCVNLFIYSQIPILLPSYQQGKNTHCNIQSNLVNCK